jgi:hypothetical protein
LSETSDKASSSRYGSVDVDSSKQKLEHVIVEAEVYQEEKELDTSDLNNSGEPSSVSDVNDSPLGESENRRAGSDFELPSDDSTLDSSEYLSTSELETLEDNSNNNPFSLSELVDLNGGVR